MKKLTLGLAVIYAGGDVSAALRAAELAGAPIAMDDLMASRLSVKRDWPATVTRVIDIPDSREQAADLELQGVPDGQPRQRFGVKLGTGPNTFRIVEEASAPGEKDEKPDKDKK